MDGPATEKRAGRGFFQGPGAGAHSAGAAWSGIGRVALAVVLIGLWFAIQIGSGLLSIGWTGGGVAWWAHVGGFVAGVILVKLFARRRVMA